MSNFSSNKPTVYVIDDDEYFGKALTRFLTTEGYPVCTFLSAQSFLNTVPPDAEGCAVSDIYMPEIDGFELQRIMRERHYKLPVIFISAHAEASDQERALESGAVGFSVKPYDEKSLLNLVQSAVGQ